MVGLPVRGAALATILNLFPPPKTPRDPSRSTGFALQYLLHPKSAPQAHYMAMWGTNKLKFMLQAKASVRVERVP